MRKRGKGRRKHLREIKALSINIVDEKYSSAISVTVRP